MYCENCGTQINEKASFCPSCGCPIGQPGYAPVKPIYIVKEIKQPPVNTKKRGTVFGILSIVFAILALIIPFFGFFFAIPAFVLSIIGMAKNCKNWVVIVGFILTLSIPAIYIFSFFEWMSNIFQPVYNSLS